MASLIKDSFEMVKDAISGSSKFDKRLITVGIRGSSKTTFLGCLHLACDLLSIQDKNFTHFIDEKVGGMRKVASQLCRGYFPEATPPGLIYEADEVMTWHTSLGKKTVRLAFAETAGEDIETLIGPYRKSMYYKVPGYRSAEILNRYICDSNGYVLTIPVSQIPGLPQIIDEPPDDLEDPDLNAARILSRIFAHKKKTHSPRIDGIAVLWTKSDMVEAWLRAKGMDLHNAETARNFLTTYFRQTASVLKDFALEHGWDKIKFFPMFVQVEKTVLPDGSVQFNKWPNQKGYKIILDEENNLPSFAMKSSFDFISWVKETFAK